MPFNIPKCKKCNSEHIITKLNIATMSEIPLVVVEGCDYLGVLLWHKLSWSPHVNHICNKINRTLEFLIRKNLHHTQQPTDIKGCTYKQTTSYI